MEDSRNLLKIILKNKNYDKNDIFYELKKESIEILKGKLEINENWMKNLKNILDHGKNIPIESKVVFSLFLNNQVDSFRNSDLERLQELNSLIINQVYNEIYFNIDGKSLYNAIFRLYIPINLRKKML